VLTDAVVRTVAPICDDLSPSRGSVLARRAALNEPPKGCGQTSYEPDPSVPRIVPGPRAGQDGGPLVLPDPMFQRLLERARTLGSPLRWVVIDDLYEEICELAISPWPRVTDGMLVFAEEERIDEEEVHMVGAIDQSTLWENARTARRAQYEGVPDAAELIDRPLQVGDTFAAALDYSVIESDAPVGGSRVEVTFRDGMDVTAEARLFTKVQVALANAPPLSREEIDPGDVTGG